MKINAIIEVEEEDFCEVDLIEVVKTGIECVGNHTLINVKEEVIK
jgi:hypothetical protein|tara:strand:+ start:1921 stop:2055 length:135 start_codon:yes stop_codon:yes gene_type:complete